MLQEVSDAVVGVLRRFVVAFVWDIALFNLGRLALLTATAGRYPRGRVLDKHSDRISAAGFLVLIAVWFGMALHNNFGTGHL